jgi:hypothetical protein
MKKTIASILASITALAGVIAGFWKDIASMFGGEEEAKVEQVMPSINISQQNVQKQDTNVKTGDVNVDEDKELEELLK